MSTIIENQINILLKQEKIIGETCTKPSLEISSLLDKNRIISLYEIRLKITKSILTKELYLKLIKSLMDYPGDKVFLVIMDYINFQELCLIDENISNILCYWKNE
ncbi:hypothetical protein SAMN05421866_2714 [Chryseobacterium oranimense]|uniref:Uncharacterized protein n=1 Tax=Chryseobacterium oranimense TaxID=421058 RepID=A0A1M5SC47_9FLAO|nr:hypothetical protein [Chryseobacterium oranimense]SHH36157.1 hypothetical protein SAMN05421866_2714 [Chryseobacterium oranimense]